MLDALFATLVVAVSLVVLAYLASLLFAAASGPLGSLLERQRFQRHQARARRSDELLRSGEVDEALVEIRAAFYLHAIYNRTLAGAVANHHTGLLARLIAITSDLQGGGVRLLSLAKTDRLLSERSDLQRRYFTARQGAPRERIREIVHRLGENSHELDNALQQLINEVRSARRPTLYH